MRISIFLITILTALHANAQINFSEQAGGFGPYVGLSKSSLQQNYGGEDQSLSEMYQGFELGLKTELYRTRWMRGNIIAAYSQQGANEYVELDNSMTPMELEMKQVKLVFDPIMFKAGPDFYHFYAGGGIYGSYLIEQTFTDPEMATRQWQEGELSKRDFGLDFAAGIHLRHFDIEARAQYGLSDLATRFDGSVVRTQFFGISIAYLYVNQHLTVKSCRDHKDRLGRKLTRN